MANGFYNTEHFTNTLIKKFIKDALYASYYTVCESKYNDKNGDWSRHMDKDLSVNDVITIACTKKDRTLYVIDRNLYSTAREDTPFEICLAYDWIFLYIFVNEVNFKRLIDKYNLKLKEW